MEEFLLDVSYGGVIGATLFLIVRFLITRGVLSKTLVVLSLAVVSVLAMFATLIFLVVSDSFGLVFRVAVTTGMIMGIPVLVLVIAALKERASVRNENLG